MPSFKKTVATAKAKVADAETKAFRARLEAIDAILEGRPDPVSSRSAGPRPRQSRSECRRGASRPPLHQPIARAFRVRRYPISPRAPNPSSKSAQVEGSGAPI